MTDFYKLLNAVVGGDFTSEQLAELQSVLTEKQEVKEEKKTTKIKELTQEEKELFAKCTRNRSEVLCCPHCGSINVIKNKECALYMRKFKPKFLTIKEIQEYMRRGEYMPTAIFSATKTDYIVKPRTIF